jgi:7-keto-8-aminopelargonate synthetase-like enzyme
VPTPTDALNAVYESIRDGARRGLSHNRAQDDRLDGRIVTIDGQRLLHFGSCSYLGLETHPALKAGVVDAVDRYGTQFASSRAYLSAPGYAEAEELLTTLFDRPTLLTPTTTLGHIAALPIILSGEDALILDRQVHNSVQTAARLASPGSFEVLAHNDIGRLEQRVGELSTSHRRIWFAVDGLYSMYGDFAPIRELNALVERYDQLWLYIDDAHGFSWTGRHGRGHALEQLSPLAASRSVVAGSMVKSFAAGGGALTFPDPELLTRVFTLGGPMIFSGPVQPPMLGAVIASARLHLSAAVPARQDQLLSLIRQFNRQADERGLPLVSHAESPIRYIGVGRGDVMYRLTGALREAGYFVDVATFPAVSARRSGIRITLTAHLNAEDVTGLIDAIATELPRALAAEGATRAEVAEAFAGVERQRAGSALS